MRTLVLMATTLFLTGAFSTAALADPDPGFGPRDFGPTPDQVLWVGVASAVVLVAGSLAGWLITSRVGSGLWRPVALWGASLLVLAQAVFWTYLVLVSDASGGPILRRDDLEGGVAIAVVVTGWAVVLTALGLGIGAAVGRGGQSRPANGS